MSLDLRGIEPAALARLLEPDSVEQLQWDADDFGALLRHQLETPIVIRRRPDDTGWIDDTGKDVNATTLGAIFADTEVDRATLRLVKDFCKRLARADNAALPSEVALVLYYGCVAAGICRNIHGFSHLTDQEIEAGFAWVLAFGWITPSLRAQVEQALSIHKAGRYH